LIGDDDVSGAFQHRQQEQPEYGAFLQLTSGYLPHDQHLVTTQVHSIESLFSMSDSITLNFYGNSRIFVHHAAEEYLRNFFG
jgi:hypothetical protein